MNVQVVCTLEGELVWISDPVAGARHDVYCLDQSGALDGLTPDAWTGDKGYVGRGMVTPIKKIEGVELLDWQKAFNTAINQTRAVVERVIANLKTWRILHTDYRRPLGTFDTTISALSGCSSTRWCELPLNKPLYHRILSRPEIEDLCGWSRRSSRLFLHRSAASGHRSWDWDTRWWSR